jgi:hypothetical protein
MVTWSGLPPPCCHWEPVQLYWVIVPVQLLEPETKAGGFPRSKIVKPLSTPIQRKLSAASPIAAGFGPAYEL